MACESRKRLATRETAATRRPPLPELDQAGRLGAAAPISVQVVPGREQSP